MMDFQWIAIALGDVAWISVAFVLGFVARSIGLPPLVGFLATGFVLNAYGIASGQMLQKLSDLGITLLLFTVGLKVDLRTLTRPQVWAVTSLHSSAVVVGFAAIIYGLALVGLPFLSDIDFPRALLIAFAMSFSSTVFVVKTLEEKGAIASLRGRIAVGILIIQDILAVGFLAVSTGKWPSVWAALVILLIPLRPVLRNVLQRVGHGELLVLFGFVLAMGGAELFELLQLKGDLGALVLGLMIAGHPYADQMAKTMLGFKDLFLLGFFLSIGLSAHPTVETVLLGAAVAPLVLAKGALFFLLLTRFRMRGRTALLASLNLANFSEFGLIVGAIGVANGWITNEWLVVLAIGLSLSFVIAATLDAFSQRIHTRYRPFWTRFQRDKLVSDDQLIDIQGATVLVLGMGGVGTGAYDAMQARHPDKVLGIDGDPVVAEKHRAAGRNVLQGDPSDADFWERMQAAHSIKLVMMTLPQLATNLTILDQLKASSFDGRVAVTAWYEDDAVALKEAGATTVFDAHIEAGAGFAGHVQE